jgi:hypothetical protein
MSAWGLSACCLITSTHLSNADNLSISTPTRMFEKLRDLRTLTGACLAHDNEDWVCLDKVQEGLTMFGNR